MKIFFVQFTNVFLPCLLNLFCFCYVLTISVPYCVYPYMKCSLDFSNFPEEISSLSHSIVSPISLHYSFKNDDLSLFAFLWNSAFSWVCISLSPLPLTSLLSSAICKASSDNHFAFLHFFFFGMVLVTVSCMNLCP